MAHAALSLMHVGGTVADLDVAMQEHAQLGVEPWAVSDALRLSTYDGEAAAMVPQHVRVAFGRLPRGPGIELVQPLAETPQSPQARLLAKTPGVNHLAYWCTDVPSTLSRFLAEGARLVTAGVPPVKDWETVLASEGERGLVPYVTSCYVRRSSGSLVELVATSLIEGPLQTMFGPQIARVLPAPPPAQGIGGAQ